MKDKTAEIEKLGELLDSINLNKNSSPPVDRESDVKCSNLILNLNVKAEPSEDEDDNNNTACFDGLRSLRSSKIKQEDSSEDENSETCPENSVLRKRGHLKKGRTVGHSSTPYQGKGTAPKQLSAENHRALKRQFFAGGDIVYPSRTIPAQEYVPLDQEPLIPDLSQLLGENLPRNVDVRNNIDQFPLDDTEICDDAVQRFLSNDELLGNNEPLPDLGISDLFLNLLDPQNDCPQSVGSVNDNSLEDQFFSNSPDNGYVSASPGNTYPESPASSLSATADLSSACASPSSSLSPSPPVVSTKKKRNPYFEGLDEKYCDRCRRAILRKALEKDGLNQKDNRNRTLLHLTIEQEDEVYAVVMLNMLQKSFQNETGKISIPSFSDLPSFLNQTDDFGRTPLLLACIYNLPRVLEYLLDCGASPALNEKFLHGSVLHYVCERGSRFHKVAEILCNKAVGILNMTNSRKETPLHIAVGYHGIKHQDASTRTHEIVDNRSLIGLLLNKNAKLSAQDELGRSPLHWMIISKNMDLLETFYSQACDWKQAVNLKNMDGRTILHGAAQLTDMDLEKQKNLIEKLVVYYASPQEQDKLGKYPKDLVPDGRKAYFSVLNGHFCENRGWQLDLVM